MCKSLEPFLDVFIHETCKRFHSNSSLFGDYFWSPVLVSFSYLFPFVKPSFHWGISDEDQWTVMISWRSRSSLSSCVRTFRGFRPRAALFKRHTAHPTEFLSCVVGPEVQTQITNWPLLHTGQETIRIKQETHSETKHLNRINTKTRII